MDGIIKTQFHGCVFEKGYKGFSRACSLHLTLHHLIIQFEEDYAALCKNNCSFGTNRSNESREFWLLYALVTEIDRSKKNSAMPSSSAGGSSNALSGSVVVSISCRHFLSFRLALGSAADANDFMDSLQTLCFFSSIDRVFAFSFSQSDPPVDASHWNVFDPQKEFKRLGVETKSLGWRFSLANWNFQICKSYPRVFIVPAKISDNVLFHAAKFRTKNRIPVLSYLHASNLVSITRSSQPLVGLKKKRSIQDEKLVEAIFGAQDSSLPDAISSLSISNNSQIVRNLIVDARPTVNAVANRALGAGFESTEIYRNCKRVFMGIDNIHVMRDSLNKLIEGVLNAPDLGYDKWAGAIESSEWLKHIRNIMDAVSLIVKSIVEENANVLIHCSDGWDRTAQLSGLAQICLDPYYRSMTGFQILIEKEWVFSGHKFMDRSGHVAKNPRSSGYKESAPIFHQFLECTWQILRCYPTEFEFQESFLLEIFEHLYSCQFGNFLLNCESDRESRQLRERTRSLWPYLESRRHIHLNPIYSPSPSNEIIHWTPGAQSIAFWTGLYYRFDEEAKIADPFVECSYSI